nr:unnamed protein product [Amyelois transitella]
MVIDKSRTPLQRYEDAIRSISSKMRNCISNRLLGEIQYETTEGIPIYSLDWDVWCKFQANTYDCGKKGQHLYRWYFDVSTRTCKSFSYSGCGGNQNKFATVQDCTSNCLPNVVYKICLVLCTCVNLCIFSVRRNIFVSHRWYFDVSTRTCKSFSYSGCGGNQNKFATVQDCTSNCLPNVSCEPVDTAAGTRAEGRGSGAVREGPASAALASPSHRVVPSTERPRTAPTLHAEQTYKLTFRRRTYFFHTKNLPNNKTFRQNHTQQLNHSSERSERMIKNFIKFVFKSVCMCELKVMAGRSPL